MKLTIEVPDEKIYEIGKETLKKKIEEYLEFMKLEKDIKELSNELKKVFSEEEYWKEVEKSKEEAWQEYKKRSWIRMKTVVDANIIFSALIKGNPVYIKILNNVDAYSSDFIFIELEKYEKRILEKVSNKQRMKEIIYKIFKKITIIPRIALTKANIKKAYSLLRI